MKILYIPRYTNWKDHRCFIYEDFGFNSMKIMINRILSIRPDWEFHVIVPANSNTLDFRINDSHDYHVVFRPMLCVDDPTLQEYHFDALYFKKLKNENDFDIIINCIPEITRNLRGVFYSLNVNDQIKIVNYVTSFVTVIDGSLIRTSDFYRQIEGVICSDFSASSDKLFIDFYKKFYLGQKIRIWDLDHFDEIVYDIENLFI